MPRILRLALALAAVPLGLYLVVVALFAVFQRSLLYHPEPEAPQVEAELAGARGLRAVADGADPQGFFLAEHDGGADATMIFAHGNGGRAVTSDHILELAAGQTLRYDVLLVEYPGYGSRGGEPNESDNVATVVRAIDLAKRRGRPIVLVGQSLGSAVVSLAAARRRGDVAVVVLTTPLPNLAQVAAFHYPFVPTFLVRDRYEADAAIARFGGPVAFVVAGRDETIPALFGLAMYRGYRGPKLLELEEEATHNTVDHRPGAEAMQRVFAFVETAVRAAR